MKKKISFFVIFCLFSLVFIDSLFAVQRTVLTHIPKKPDYIQDEFYLMRQAQAAYNIGDYGMALKRVQFAREFRKARVEWELYTLQNSFRPAEVRRVGESMSEIMPVLETREDYDAIEIITRYQKNPRSVNATRNSTRLIEYIGSYTEFPEADFLIGNIYYIEGDYILAEKYFQNAWKNRTLLDVPDQQYDILYKLANLSDMQGDEIAYEEFLTAVVRDDQYFKNSNMQNAMLRIIKLGRAGCVDNLFNLFRPDNYLMLDAYINLSRLYEKNGDSREALYLSALASLTCFTRMYAIVAKRAPDYSYQGVSNFFERAFTYSDVTRWAYENDVWQSLENLAELADKNGCQAFARELTDIMQNFQIAKR